MTPFMSQSDVYFVGSFFSTKENFIFLKAAFSLTFSDAIHTLLEGWLAEVCHQTSFNVI